MITRSKLVEQLRDSQIRSQHKWSPLVIFSPKPSLSTWIDVAVAILWATLFIVCVTSSYMTLYFRHFWLSFAIICLGILIPIRLRISRQTIVRKKDRRLLLPLSICETSCTVPLNQLYEDPSGESLNSMDGI